MATVESVQGVKSVQESDDCSDSMWSPLSAMCRKNGFSSSYLCKEKSCNSIDSKLTKYNCIVKINGLKNLTNSTTKQTRALGPIHLRPRAGSDKKGSDRHIKVNTKRNNHSLRDSQHQAQTGSLNNNNEESSAVLRLPSMSPTTNENLHNDTIRNSQEARSAPQQQVHKCDSQDLKHSGNNPSKVFQVQGGNCSVPARLTNGHRLSLRRMGVHSLNHNGLSMLSLQNGRCVTSRTKTAPNGPPLPVPGVPPPKAANVPPPAKIPSPERGKDISGSTDISHPRVLLGRIHSSPKPPTPPTIQSSATESCSAKLKRSCSSSSLPITSQANGAVQRSQSSNSSLFLLTQENSCSSTSSLVSTSSQEIGSANNDAKKLTTCLWSKCREELAPSQLMEHLQSCHVKSQTGESFVCLWDGCKVYNKASCSKKWLDRHIVIHSGDKPFPCIVDGCGQQFKSQYSLERHVNSHFNSCRANGKLCRSKEDTPSKQAKKKKAKRKRTLPARTDDFFDPRTMEGVQQRLVQLSRSTNMDICTSGNYVTFHSTVIARRTDSSGVIQVLQHWSPENILADSWVPESQAEKMPTKVLSLSELPHDTVVHLDSSMYARHRYRKHRRK